MKKQSSGTVRIKYSIGFKLILIISVIVIVSLGALTGLVSYFVGSDVRVTAEQNNHTVNTRSASATESFLTTLRSNVFLLLDMLNAGGSAGSAGVLSRQTTAMFFERNQDVAAIIIPGSGNSARSLYNNRFFLSNELDTSVIDQFLTIHAEEVSRSEAGETIALNCAPIFNLPVLAVLFPWKESGFNQTAIVFFSSESLSDSFSGSTVNESFMINDAGDLLIHGDFQQVKAGINMSNNPLVEEMRRNNDDNRQVLYTMDGKTYFGAYEKLSIGDIGVLTTVEQSVVLEAVTQTLIRNLWLSLSILFLAVLFIWIYSKTISNPLRRLTAASEQIGQGNFDITLKSKARDELGVLTKSFTSMAKGLAERERLKDTFGRFINKNIAEKAARGELELGGENKQVTIFFSDIRSFTAISEKLEPAEVVEFLNEYMTRMVECVNKTNGVVDKFIGDAIMAIWGAPESSGSPAQDALNCVRAALMMRAALREYNKDRGGDKRPIIKIGCGINSGPVIAGQIGSKSRMEYTCIGDAVNFASRTESLNKPLGTDILITEDTYNLIREHVAVEPMPTVTVKGKEKPQRLYAVVNMPQAEDIPGAGKNGPKSLAEVRSLLGIPTPDIEKVDLDADEKKYKIQGN